MIIIMGILTMVTLIIIITNRAFPQDITLVQELE